MYICTYECKCVCTLTLSLFVMEVVCVLCILWKVIIYSINAHIQRLSPVCISMLFKQYKKHSQNPPYTHPSKGILFMSNSHSNPSYIIMLQSQLESANVGSLSKTHTGSKSRHMFYTLVQSAS